MRESDNQTNQSGGAALSTRPTLSILVTSAGEVGSLDEWLRSFAGSCEEIAAQVIVIRAGEPVGLKGVMRAYPSVLFLTAAAGTGEAGLRRLGVQAADGDVIFLHSADRPYRELLPHRLLASLDPEAVITPN